MLFGTVAASGTVVAGRAELVCETEGCLVQHAIATPLVIDDRVAGIKPQHLATLIYTSGTTGKAKGVRLSHDCWTYEASAVVSTGLLNAGDVQYLWLPLSHVFGKMLLCLPIQVGFPTVVDGRVDKIVENLPETKPT